MVLCGNLDKSKPRSGSKPILLWSCIFVGSGNRSNENTDHCIRVWKERDKLAESLGIELKLFVPRKLLRASGIFPVIDFFEREKPDLILDCPGKREKGNEKVYDRRVAWPRDNFQMFGRNVCATPWDYDSMKALIGNLGLDLPLFHSALGEGGYGISTSQHFIFADLKWEAPGLDNVSKSGYGVYKLPVLGTPKEGMDKKERKLFQRMKENDHIDREVNCAETPDGNMLLVANQTYFFVFGSEVERIRKQSAAKLYVIPEHDEEGRAVNYLQFPTKDIIMPLGHPGLAAFLRRNTGKKRVHEIETFPDEISPHIAGGGLRCRTNVIVT
jgi:hypothetical protein